MRDYRRPWMNSHVFASPAMQQRRGLQESAYQSDQARRLQETEGEKNRKLQEEMQKRDLAAQKRMAAQARNAQMWGGLMGAGGNILGSIAGPWAMAALI